MPGFLVPVPPRGQCPGGRAGPWHCSSVSFFLKNSRTRKLFSQPEVSAGITHVLLTEHEGSACFAVVAAVAVGPLLLNLPQ